MVLSNGTTHTTRQNVVNFEVAAPGCTHAWDQITAQNGVINTDSCGEDITYSGYDTQQVIRVETTAAEGGDADTLKDRVIGTRVAEVLPVVAYAWLLTDNAGWQPVLIGDKGLIPDPTPGGGG